MIGKIWKKLKKILNNKVVVIIAIFAFLFVGSTVSKVQADDNYNFGTAFQYYLLDNRKDDIQSGAENKKATKFMGQLGSGGVSGNFSYDDMVNSAPNGQSQTAKSFASMMATYSTFGYFSNKIQGFETIKSMAVRLFALIILFLPAIILDMVSLMVDALIGIFTKLNIIPLLAQAITNWKFASDLADILGMDMNQMKTLMEVLLGFSVAVFLFVLVMALRHGSGNLDQKYSRKLKGKFLTIIALPIVVVFSAMLISGFSSGFQKATDDNNFGRFLVDDRSWAYNYNFAPDGMTSTSSDISPSKRSYVDLKFDPYTATGADRIKNINTNSSIIGTSGKEAGVFSNSALLLSYGTGLSFSATDYINYKGTKASEDLFGGATGQSFGSYYSYANSLGKKLVDVDNGLTGSGASAEKPDGSFVKAVNDYKDDKGNLIMSPSTTWRDRFIYGVKNSGSMDAYYGEQPSSEMVHNRVGSGSSGNTISDQSMFLVLSSIFNETGGRYSIDAPARGLSQMKANFDSNRSDYYVTSMVGTPMISIIGLLTEPLIKLIIFVTLLTAIFSLGIIDMNLRPISTYFKSYILGDPEYLEAFIVYAMGILGTQISMIVIPPLFTNVMNGISNIVVKAVPKAVGFEPQSPQASMMYNGTTILVSGFVAIFFAWLYIKSPSFREKMISMFSFCWDWAKTTGDRLEMQANPYASRVKATNKESAMNNPIHQALLRSNEAGESWDQTLKNASKGLVEDTLPNKFKSKDAQKTSNDKPTSESDSSDNNNQTQTPEEIARRGQFERINNGLRDVQNSANSDNPTASDAVGAEDAINKFKEEPTQKNLNNAQDKLLALRQRMVDNNAPEEDIAKVDQALNELQSLGDKKHLDTSPIKSANLPLRDTNDEDKPSPWKDDLKPDSKDNSEEESEKTNTDKGSKDKPKKSDNGSNDDFSGSKNQNNGKEQQSNSSDNSDGTIASRNDKKSGKSKTIKHIQSETETHVNQHDNNQFNKNIHNANETNKKVSNNNQNNVTRRTNTETEQRTIDQIKKRVINEQQVKILTSSLGRSANNQKVASAIQNIQRSSNKGDLNRGLRELRRSISGLAPAQKRAIDKDKMVKTINNILK